MDKIQEKALIAARAIYDLNVSELKIGTPRKDIMSFGWADKLIKSYNLKLIDVIK